MRPFCISGRYFCTKLLITTNIMNPYEMQWSSATPGLLIILLDQSGSMTNKYDDNMTKSEFASKTVSSTPSSSATSTAKAPRTAHSSLSSVTTTTSTSCAPATSRIWTPSPCILMM